jgi:hypothetical protein
MTDEYLDHLVRDADPRRPDLVQRLGGAEHSLLEEIMSVPTLESVPAPAAARRPRRIPRRLAGTVAAAAAVTGVLGATALLRDQSPPDPYGSWTGPVGLPGAGTGGTGGGYEMDLKAAQSHPRLLVDEPGWKVTTVYGFAAAEGTIGFINDGRSLEMNWYPADRYDSYYKDRLEVSKPQWTTVAGVQASVVRYSANDFAAMLKPANGAFVELRADGKLDRAAFDALLTKVVQVTPQKFLAALPPEVITPGKVREAAVKALADVPIPPGFDVESVDVAGANDPYQFGAAVTGQVTCTWIAEWIRADEAGDDGAADRAGAALRSSRNWTVLKGMVDEGDWAEVVWEIADKVADGKVPNGYQDGLGCKR